MNDEVANVLVAQLLYLANDDPDKDITLYINSPGGSVSAGMAIYDAMQVCVCFPRYTYGDFVECMCVSLWGRLFGVDKWMAYSGVFVCCGDVWWLDRHAQKHAWVLVCMRMREAWMYIYVCVWRCGLPFVFVNLSPVGSCHDILVLRWSSAVLLVLFEVS